MFNCMQTILHIRLNNIEDSPQTSHVLVTTQVGPFTKAFTSNLRNFESEERYL